jgi:hypothetical protein
MPVTVPLHTLKTFTSPVNTRMPVDANAVRTNDNLLTTAFNAHDSDASIHVQSGTLAQRPATGVEGSVWVCTDTQDTYLYTGSAWVQTSWAHWYGGFYDTTDQAAAAVNTAQLVTLNTTGMTRGTALVDNSKARVSYAGDYNVQFSAQLLNTDSAEHDVFFWFAKNGTAIADSAGRVTVQKKHGSIDGHLIVAWNIYTALVANDYVQLYWQSTGTAVSLETIASSGSVPRSPSVILTINRI